MINLAEFNKMSLHINLSRFNPNIIRVENIPIVLFKNDLLQYNDKDFKDDKNLPKIDKFYSGYYFIKGYDIEYRGKLDKNGMPTFMQTLNLTRREWEKP